MITKKLTVTMISDDLKLHCWNDKEGEDTADWQIHLKGNLIVGYSTFWQDVKLEERTVWVPPRKEDEGLNYCIQKRCDDQRSMWSTNSWFGNLNNWNATVKICAAMDQNVLLNVPMPSITEQFVDMSKEIIVPIEWLETIGDKCPDLEDVRRILSMVTKPNSKSGGVPWWKLNSLGEVRDVAKMGLDEYRNCEDPKKDVEGMDQGAGKGQDSINNGTASKKFQKLVDKGSKIVAVKIFQYGMNVAKGQFKYLTEMLQVLNIIKDENEIPNFKFPIDPKLCECNKKGLSNKCWGCDKVMKSGWVFDDNGMMENIEYWDIECVQDVDRMTDGNCPSHSIDGIRTHETQELCEFYKTIDCKGIGDPSQ